MNKQQRLAGRLHCTAKIPRTTGSMPPSVCLNEFKQMEVQSWLVSVTVQSAARAMAAKCLSDTNKAQTLSHTTHS